MQELDIVESKDVKIKQQEQLRDFILNDLDLQLFKRGKTSAFVLPLEIAVLIASYVSDDELDHEPRVANFIDTYKNETWKYKSEFKFNTDESLLKFEATNQFFDRGIRLFWSRHLRESFFQPQT